jgi:hypothetical protein
VSLADDKEGMLGLRVRKELEQPTNESVVHTGEDGKPGTVRSVDNTTREVRLYHMRGGSKAPAPPGTTAPGTSRKPPPQPETLGGLFGKLFKK